MHVWVLISDRLAFAITCNISLSLLYYLSYKPILISLLVLLKWKNLITLLVSRKERFLKNRFLSILNKCICQIISLNLPSLFWGFLLNKARSKSCASWLKNCGIPSFALKNKSKSRISLIMSSLVTQKRESQNGGNKKAKHAKFSEKGTCAYQEKRDVRNSKSSLLSCYLRFEIPPFALLATMKQTTSWLLLSNQSLIHGLTLSFTVGLSLSKKKCYLLNWKIFKNDEKCFFFHLKSSFCSQDI